MCGGEVNVTTHGTISSPGSPGRYPINRDCIWKLTTDPTKLIQLHFFTMQLETHETCQYDYLAVNSRKMKCKRFESIQQKKKILFSDLQWSIDYRCFIGKVL